MTDLIGKGVRQLLHDEQRTQCAGPAGELFWSDSVRGFLTPAAVRVARVAQVLVQ